MLRCIEECETLHPPFHDYSLHKARMPRNIANAWTGNLLEVGPVRGGLS